VQATVGLTNYGGAKLGMSAVVKLKDKVSGATLETHNVVLDDAGLTSFTTGLSAGDYNAVAKGSHWLAQAKAVTIDAGGNATVAFSLLNGDVNGDNVVNFSDYLVLQTQYKKPAGTWSADLNGDGVVNFADYLILQANYKKSGSAF